MITQAFVTALLLTRSPRLAEEAVMSAIRRSDCTAESVLHMTVAECLNVNVDRSRSEMSASAAMLPPELRWLLTLPCRKRHCFVLRFLIGMTREECEQVLDIEPSLVDEEVSEAVRWRPAEFALMLKFAPFSVAQQCSLRRTSW